MTFNQKEYAKKYIKDRRKSDADFAARQVFFATRWQKRNPVRAALTTYKNRARRSGREFSLSDAEFEALVRSDCVYCGAIPQPINGIDRVDNSLGYTKENSKPACKKCNKAKLDSSLDDFKAWIKQAAIHMELFN